MIAALIANDPAPLPDAVAATMRRLEGAYSVAALAEETLVAFRDPLAVRPLSLGRIGDDWVVASETCALDLVGADWVRDVRPGEVVWVDADGLHRGPGGPVVARGAVHLRARLLRAARLAPRRRRGLRRPGAHGRAARGGGAGRRRLRDADPRLRHAGGDRLLQGVGPALRGRADQEPLRHRTFIQPDQGLREQGIRLKFNPLADIEGRRVVIVDDSIVRGNTMRQLVAMLFDGGAAEVHVRISSPPVVSPCFYGIDMADEDELAAAHRSVEQMRETIGATSLHYLSLAGMQEATQLPESSVCRACFTREYPTRVPAGRNLAKLRFEPAPAL